MAINWGKEAAGFADGLVRGATAVAQIYQAGAYGDYYRQEAERRRREDPYNDPTYRRDIERANRLVPKPKPASTPVPLATSPGTEMAGVTPVRGMGVIPYDQVFPTTPRFADGGEVLRARQRSFLTASDPAQAQGRSEQEIFDEEFRRMFYAAQPQPAPSTEVMQERGRIEERDRAVGPAMTDRPMTRPVISDAPSHVEATNEPAPSGPAPLLGPSRQGRETIRSRVDEAANAPAPSRSPPAPPAEGVLPGTGAAGAMARPGGHQQTISPRVWERVRRAVDATAPKGDPQHVEATNEPTSAPEPALPSPPSSGQPAAPRPPPVTSPPSRPAAPPAAPGRTSTPPPSAPPSAAVPAAPGGAAPPSSAPPLASSPQSGITIERYSSRPVVGPANATQADFDAILGSALNGAQRYASRAYQLDESGRVAPYMPGGTGGGVQAVMSGTGAALPQAVRAIDQALESAAGEPFTDAMRSTMRMLALYDFYARSGQSDKADRMAFELLQYSSMVAAMYGREALELARRGDINGATQSVVKAFNSVPNGQEARIENGRAVIYDQFNGQPQQEVPLDDPRLILTLARGFQDRGATFALIAARAQRVAQKGQRTPLQDELTRSQIDLNRARLDKIKAGGGGGGGGNVNRTSYINSLGFNPGTASPTQAAQPRGYVDDGPPEGPGSGDDQVAGVGGGGPAPVQQTAATTDDLSGGEGDAVLSGGTGSDTLSDAAPEPLPPGTQLAQAQAPSGNPGITPRREAHGVTPGSRAGKYYEPPPFDPGRDIYDQRRARQLAPQGRDPNKGPFADPRDGTVLVGLKHPDYDRLKDEAAVVGVSVRPHPKDPKREIVVPHNVPSQQVAWVREGNTFRPVDARRDDPLTPTERGQLEELRRLQAEAVARKDRGEAALIQRNISTWTKEAERRLKQREEAIKQTMVNKITPAQAATLEEAISTAISPKGADPTVAPLLQSLSTLSYGQIFDVAQNIMKLNRVGPRQSVEMLGFMLQPGSAHNARRYQVLGRDVSDTGVVVELPAVTDKEGKPIAPGFPTKLLIDDDTFKSINDAAARNTQKWVQDYRSRKSMGKLGRMWSGWRNQPPPPEIYE